MTSTTLHRAQWALPIETPPLSDGAVAVEGDRIAWVGPWSKRPRKYRDLPAKQLIDHGHAAITPGFVNPHSHVILHYARGTADHAGFLDWFREGIITLDMGDPERNRAACRDGYLEGLNAGITCWGDNHFRLEPFEVALELGIRATCFLEVFGIRGDADKQLTDLRAKIAEGRAHETEAVRLAFSPHAPYTVPPGLLRAIGEESRASGRPLSIHLAESREEREYMTSTRGAMRRLFGRQTVKLIPPITTSLTRYLKDHHCLTERTLVIHGVHLTPDELTDCARAKATLVHCPVSNSRLRCGVAPIEDALRRKVRLAIGTDSVASGERHDPFLAMQLAYHLQQATHSEPVRLTPAALLQAATLGGAIALGRGDQLGSLAAGKAADLVILALPPPAHPHRTVEESIVLAGERSWVREVWIGGARRV
ncbi:MAG: amidohydrolase family protein [bacterium]